MAAINTMAVNGTARRAAAAAFVVANAKLRPHVASHGPPTVCVLVKGTHDDGDVRHICRGAGALILWDVIDSDRAWNL